MATMGLLKNTVQKYDWGSRTAIPELLGEKNFSDEPAAELWMGAHPKAPSLVDQNGQWIALNDLIAQNPQAVLGEQVARKFHNQLPYLLKVLAAAKPLSIQAHPSREQARRGFEFENDAGIPLDATNRNYKDPNHKPECICALSPFWALYGFRSIAEILFLMGEICPHGLGSELGRLKKQADPGGLKRFFSKLMSMENDQKMQVIEEATLNVHKRLHQEPAFHWSAKLGVEYPSDIGMLAPLYLNLIQLKPGQALFLPAGELHAYLEGVGIELMANSDNVLRGGLTPKHIDVPELLKVLNFRPHKIKRLGAKKRGQTEKAYASSAEEFALSVIAISNDDFYQKSNMYSAEILLCTEGKAQLKTSGSSRSLDLQKGNSAIVFAEAGSYTIKGNAVLFKAAVPPQQ
jgi:mannose-6-phosphate isomerase